MVKFSLHNHTTESDGQLSPLEVIALAVKKGFGLISFSDHDKNLDMNHLDELLERSDYSSHYLSDEARLIESPDKSRLVVLKGNEVTAERSKDEKKTLFSAPYAHLLGIGYKGQLDSWESIECTIKDIKKKGGVLIAPHPVAPAFWGIGEENLKRYQEDIDAIELNGILVSIWAPFNRKAKRLAKELKKPVICGADSHFKGTYLEGFYNISDYKPKLLQKYPMDWLKDVIDKREYTLIDWYDTKKAKYKIIQGGAKSFVAARLKPLIKRALENIRK